MDAQQTFARCSIGVRLIFNCLLSHVAFAFVSTKKVNIFRFDQKGHQPSLQPKSLQPPFQPRQSPAFVSTKTITSLKSHHHSPSFQPKRSPTFASTKKVTSFPFKQNGHQLSLKTQRVASLRFNQSNRQPLLQPKRITRSRVNESGRQPPFQPKRSQASVTLKKVVGPCYIVKSPFT